MSLGVFSKRFAVGAACLLTLPLATPSWAEMPPLGYVGPAPVLNSTASPPPLGYVGPIAHYGAVGVHPVPTAIPPPLGYVGPVPQTGGPITVVTVSSPLSSLPSSPSPPPPLLPPSVPPPDVVRETVSLPVAPTALVASQAPSPQIVAAQPNVTLADRLQTPSRMPASMPIGYLGPVPPALGYTGPALVASPPTPDQLIPYADDVPSAHSGETMITATQMHSDSETQITIATGNVEIVRGDYVLHADKVTYDQKTGIMTADGHVAVLTPTGEVEFSDHEEVTGDMKQAFTKRVGILFPDNSRMAGQTGERFDERYSVIDKAMYTACNICRENPDVPPIWQLRANTITHDNVEHEVYYHDATIDFEGVPVLYTPYVSAPDPSVERRQGFLSPSPGVSGNIGTFLRVPYYVDIAPDKDMTITPTFSTTDKLQIDTQYRERFAEGKLNVEGSLTRADLLNDYGIDEGDQWRGHLFGNFLYNLNSTWRVGTDVQYATDKSYLPRYYISSLDQTTSRAYVEGLQGRDYAALNSYVFEDLRAGTDVSEPFVAPSATINLLGDPGQTLGGRWSFSGNTLVTTRDNTDQTLAQQGPNTRRVSTNTGWERQMISDTGLETTVSGLFRTDSYWANNVIAADGDVYKNALFTRQFEQANAIMRYPMGRSGDGYQQLVEPIIGLTAAPDVRQIAEQPNEESQDVEFDETSLFSPNRFTGSDLIEGGSRVTYGIRNAITADSGARVDIFGGESYDFTANSDFPAETGLNGHASDYVGRVDLEPSKWFNANYGFRLAQNDFSPQRQDALVSVGDPIFRPYVRYLEAYESDITTGFVGQVKQATIGFSSKFKKYWTLSGNHTQGFSPQPGPRSSALTLAYVDECLAFGITANNNETNRADISSGTSVVFHVYLKNLGGTNTDSTSSIQFPAEFRQTAQ